MKRTVCGAPFVSASGRGLCRVVRSETSVHSAERSSTVARTPAATPVIHPHRASLQLRRVPLPKESQTWRSSSCLGLDRVAPRSRECPCEAFYVVELVDERCMSSEVVIITAR